MWKLSWKSRHAALTFDVSTLSLLHRARRPHSGLFHRMSARYLCNMLLSALLAVTVFSSICSAIKFDIPGRANPSTKCIWNYALSDTLVIVNLQIGPTPSSAVGVEGQQVDVEIVDASHHNNIYLDKRDIKGETRMAVNTHSHSDLGVCITNRLKKSG